MAKYQRVQIPSQSQAGLPEPPIFDISSSRQIPAPALAPAKKKFVTKTLGSGFRSDQVV